MLVAPVGVEAMGDDHLRSASTAFLSRRQKDPDPPPNSNTGCHANLNLRRDVRKSQLGLSCGRGSPRPERVVSEDAERGAVREMALDVECVMDGGMNGQEPLG